jgi:hypothetical protein
MNFSELFNIYFLSITVATTLPVNIIEKATDFFTEQPENQNIFINIDL